MSFPNSSRNSPIPRLSVGSNSLDPASVYLSVITIGELRKGVEKLRESPRQAQLRVWLADDLLVRFAGRILTLDVPVMLTWGALTGRLERDGRPLPALDSLLAALALQHSCVVATRNEDDFRDTGVPVINPWR